MTSAQVLDLKGNKTHEVKLSEAIFDAEPKMGPMHTALRRQLANARSGSANTKTRAEVRGGGAKPWRQKGTGRARAGSRRSPLWAGGGVIFGPKPRDFSFAMPKKMRAAALKSALAAKKDDLVVVKGFDEVKEPKTKTAIQIYRALKIDGKKVLLVLDYSTDTDKTITLAARNIEGTKVVHISNLSVKDLLDSEVILTTESALQAIGKRFEAKDREPKKEKSPSRTKADYKDKAAKKAAERAANPPKAKAEKPKKEKEPKAAKHAEAPPKQEKHDKKGGEEKQKKVAPQAEGAEPTQAKPEEAHEEKQAKAAPKKAAKEEASEKPAKKSKKDE
jgi:large subunit ribosomal protein L4